MNKLSDDFLAITKFKPMAGAKPFPPEVIRAYRSRVPSDLIELWEAFGQCGFNKGSFWLTNPDDFDYLLEDLLEGKQTLQAEDCSVISRSAFGHLHLWSRKYRRVFYIKMHDLTLNVRFDEPSTNPNADNNALSAHFIMLKPYEDPRLDIVGDDSQDLLKPAQKTLGPVNEDECYGFTLMLPLGGADVLDNLQIVGLHSHLGILSQMAELRVVDLTTWPIKQIE